MDREQAIFVLRTQAEKHEIIAKVARAIEDNVIAKDRETIATALRYAISVLQGAEKEAE